MNFRNIIVCVSLFLLPVAAFPAEDQVQQLRLQLQQLKDEFEKSRQQQQQQIEALTKKLEVLSSPAAVAPTPAPARTDEQQKLEQELAAETAARPPSQPSAQNSPTLPAAASGAHAGSSYMNISFGTLVDAGWSSETDPSARLQLGDHDPI